MRSESVTSLPEARATIHRPSLSKAQIRILGSCSYDTAGNEMGEKFLNSSQWTVVV